MATPTTITQLTMQMGTSDQALSTRKQSWAEQAKTEEKSIGKSHTLATNLKSWSKVVRSAPIAEGFDLEGETNSTANVKITMENVKEEIILANRSCVLCTGVESSFNSCRGIFKAHMIHIGGG